MAVLQSHMPCVNRILVPSFAASSHSEPLSSSQFQSFHDRQRSPSCNSQACSQDLSAGRRSKYSQLGSCHFRRKGALPSGKFISSSACGSSTHLQRDQHSITASCSTIQVEVPTPHGAKVKKEQRHILLHSGVHGHGSTASRGLEAGCTFNPRTKFRLSFVRLSDAARLQRPPIIIPLAPMVKQKMLRQAVQVELMVVTENWLASEKAIASAAAEEAMTLARAAANAAKDAAMYAEAEAQCMDPYYNFPSEMDLLRLERARLSEMERVAAAQRIQYDSEEECATPSEWSQKDKIRVEDWTSSARNVDNAVALRGLEVDPPSRNLHELKTQQAGTERRRENVVVRSNRREQRLLKRERALEKAERAAAAIASAPVPPRTKRAQPAYDSDPVRSYLRDIGKTKLLTAAEEIELSTGIQDLLKMEKVRDSLMEQIGQKPTLAEWARAASMEQHAFEARLREGQFCKDKMVNSNLRLVVSIAKNYQGRGMTFQDLIQVGSMGLIRGAEKFDHNKGFKFSTFAFWWIRQAVTRSIADQSRIIRLPIHMYEVITRVNKAKKMFIQEHGCSPRDEEVAELIGMTVEKLKMIVKSARAPTSMERPAGKENDVTIGELVPDKDVESPEDTITKRLLKQDLEQVLHTLNPRERDVLRLRYGMHDGRMKTLEEIGIVFGVSRERIRQIESKAFRKLRQPSRNNLLREYLPNV